MKRLLLLSLFVLVPGIQTTFDQGFSFCHPEKTGRALHMPSHHPEGQRAARSGNSYVMRFKEKHKASADAAGLYDAIIPPLCLLMLIYLSLSLQEPKNRNVP